MNLVMIQAFACGALEWFQQALIRLCVCAAVALFAVLVLRTQTVRDAAARIASLWRGATHFTRLAVLTLLSVCVIDAGEKMRSGGGALGDRALPNVTAEEIAQGWRLVAETNCEADVYVMPEGVSPSFNWHKRGTFSEWARLDLGDFAFPLGTNGGAVTSFSVFNDGRIRPTPRDAAREICAVGVPMLAMQGASRFWVGGTARSVIAPYQGKVLTWENFFLNADTNLPVNAQIELVANGDFVTRSNDVERIYRRVEPFDWDGDGLENTVDSDPLVAGADAHGTNAEWYNTVCSNVLEAVEGDGSAGTPRPTLSWLDGVNTNAYYFVDVVTTNYLAPIYFTGDRESRLGNPVVVARGGETNHVPLLIGINYAVTSTVPFAVSIPDDGFTSVTTNTVSNYEVRWPLNFVVSGSPSGYAVCATPFDPGGTFVWGATSCSGGMREIPSMSTACDYTTNGNWLGFTCDGDDCGCHGCSLQGFYALEDSLFELPLLACGCGSQSPAPHNPTNEPPASASISLALDTAVVLFESAYTNAVGDSGSRHSTASMLTVEYSNQTDNALTVSLLVQTGDDKILLCDLEAHSYISTWNVTCPARTSGQRVFQIEGRKRSLNQGDVHFKGAIGEAEDSASVTVVEIALTPERRTGDDFLHRHWFGVCENVWCEAYPTGMGVSWSCNGHGTIVPSGSFHSHKVPFEANSYNLTAAIGSIHLPISVQSFFPSDIAVLQNEDYSIVVLTNAIGSGEAGCIGLALPLHCQPTNVSFAGIELCEMPTPAAMFTQYFATTNWIGLRDHQGSAISSDWFTPSALNYFATDVAAIGYCEQPWLGGGSLIWNIPDMCRPLSNQNMQTNSFAITEQSFSITADGTVRVMKFGYVVERMTNETINLWRPYNGD